MTLPELGPCQILPLAPSQPASFVGVGLHLIKSLCLVRCEGCAVPLLGMLINLGVRGRGKCEGIECVVDTGSVEGWL